MIQIIAHIPIFNDYGAAIGKWMDYETSKFDVRIVAGATLPLNRWALLEEYFRWFQAGLIDDIAMIAETDIRNKKQLVERKSMYSQLQSQLQSMEEAIKDKDVVYYDKHAGHGVQYKDKLYQVIRARDVVLID